MNTATSISDADMTERLNALYAAHSSKIDPAFRKAARRTILYMEW